MADERQVSRRMFLSGLAGAGVGLVAGGRASEPTVQAASPPAAIKAPPRVAPTPSVAPGGPAVGRVQPPAQKHVEAQVHVNQAGWRPEEMKRAIIPATGPIIGNGFAVVDDDVIPGVRYQGRLSEYTKPIAHTHRYPYHYFAGFDDFQRPGRYRIRLSDGHLSAPFTIGPDVYDRLIPLVLQYFDVQRCGEQHSPLRGPCHRDDGIAVGGPRHGARIDAAGGWHDAGDYLKFVETTSYVTAVMLVAYDHYPRAFRRDAPPGRLPLLLEYARVGVEWLLKMHPRPDEFYFQVGTDSDHDTWRLPEDDDSAHESDWTPRPVLFGIGANLAGRCACAFAMAARLYRPYAPRLAARCLAAAQSVYALGLSHPRVLTTKPYSYYPETTWTDDMEWGAVELYKTTGRRDYLDQATGFAQQAKPDGDTMSVYNVHAPAHFALHPLVPPRTQALLRDRLRAHAERVRGFAEASPYGLGTPYVWGTAEAAAGAALTCRLYALLSGDRSYLEIAQRQRDFILGANPFDLSCLIGVGTRYPLFPHHQIANIKNVELTGALVGGPSDAKSYLSQHIPLGHSEFATQTGGPLPPDDPPNQVAVYHDAVQDYVTNEAANDYTAKFLLLAASYVG